MEFIFVVPRAHTEIRVSLTAWRFDRKEQLERHGIAKWVGNYSF